VEHLAQALALSFPSQEPAWFWVLLVVLSGGLFGHGKNYAYNQQKQYKRDIFADQQAIYNSFGQYSRDLPLLGQGRLDQSEYNQMQSFYTDYQGFRAWKSTLKTEEARTQALQEYNHLAAPYQQMFGVVNANPQYYLGANALGGPAGAQADIQNQMQTSALGVPYRSRQSYQQLQSSFTDIQSYLAEYGVTDKRKGIASTLYSGQYQDLSSQIGFQQDIQSRDLGFTQRDATISQAGRGIQKDQLDWNVAHFDRNSSEEIQRALGTLQRREATPAYISRLKEQQAFDKDILGRQRDNAYASDSLSTDRENASITDAKRSLSDLSTEMDSLNKLYEATSNSIGDLKDEFFNVTKSLKDFGRALDAINNAR
jgi:hypothetical protein